MTLEEVVDHLAEIELAAQERQRKEILEPLSDDQIAELISRLWSEERDYVKRFVYHSLAELGYRRGLRRAREVNAQVYCILHDCDATKCPKGSHDD